MSLLIIWFLHYVSAYKKRQNEQKDKTNFAHFKMNLHCIVLVAVAMAQDHAVHISQVKCHVYASHHRSLSIEAIQSEQLSNSAALTEYVR